MFYFSWQFYKIVTLLTASEGFVILIYYYGDIFMTHVFLIRSVFNFEHQHEIYIYWS